MECSGVAWRGKGVCGRHCFTPLMLQYEMVCKLGAQVERLMEVAGREKVLFVLLEDMKADPGREYRRVLEFLGVEDDLRTVFSVVNQSKVAKYQFVHWFLRTLAHLKWSSSLRYYSLHIRLLDRLFSLNLSRKSGIESISVSPVFRKKLVDVFSADVILLSTLIGRDLSHWVE